MGRRWEEKDTGSRGPPITMSNGHNRPTLQTQKADRSRRRSRGSWCGKKGPDYETWSRGERKVRGSLDEKQSLFISCCACVKVSQSPGPPSRSFPEFADSWGLRDSNTPRLTHCHFISLCAPQ